MENLLALLLRMCSDNMLKKVLKAFREYDMLGESKEITVALSGGADSVCLFYLLLELKRELGFSLSAVHVNHQLRGEESERDEAFVRNICNEHNVPLTIERVDVRQRTALTGESIELAARNLRYEIFRNVNKGVVATAHTASDNLETVLYNITRGTGLKGVSGIPPKRDIFIRPLIFCTRQEVEDYLTKSLKKYVTDSSNLTDDYVRNRLRHNVVPLLKDINPSVEDAASRMCQTLREDEDFLTLTAEKIYLLCVKKDYLDAALLRLQHVSVIKRVISRYALAQADILLDSLHLENCLAVLNDGGKTSLSKKLFAVCKDERFFITDETKESVNYAYKTEVKELSFTKNEKINNLLLKNTIDCDKISGSLVIRQRNMSDSIRLKGRNCTKTLKKLFSEKKIPLGERDIIPVAADDLGVVWIYGIGVSERVQVDDATTNVKQFVVKKIDNHKKSGDVKYD